MGETLVEVYMTIKFTRGTPKDKAPIKKPRKPRAKKSSADKKAQATLTGLDEVLGKFHEQTDTELGEFIQPSAENAKKASHRLTHEQREARYVLLHRMIIRKVPVDEICRVLKISIAMYYRLKTTLDERMRLDVSKIDVPYMIGDSLAFYDEVRAMALTISSSASIKDQRIKLSAMTVALRAEEDKNEFLTACGVYSSPVIEQIIRGMLTLSSIPRIADGHLEKTVEAEEVNFELAKILRQHAAQRALTIIQGE